MADLDNKELLDAQEQEDPETEARILNRKERREKREKKRLFIKEIISWVLCLVCAFLIAMVLRTYVFEFVRVDGGSMQPTLSTDERLFVEKLSKFSSDKPGINDIVIVHYPAQGNKAFVKRIVGLPGDTLCVKDGILYRNGTAVEEDFTLDDKMRLDFEEITVPENNYFVMGDNRNDSMDSRSVGTIPKEDIVGHAVCTIWPIWDIKLLN